MDLINYNIQNAVATVTLNRADKHNALNPAMISALRETFVQAAQDSKVQVVVVRGEGISFCAGADLHWMKQSIDMHKDENLTSALALYDMYHAIYTCPKPVLGAIHGNAFGGGVGMIACMDVAIMHKDAIFVFE
ncbi:MAG: enoyl-CoA hydratase-related protein [Bdellovibrionota bacterium]